MKKWLELTEQERRELRHMVEECWSAGDTLSEIAEKFDLHIDRVSQLVRRFQYRVKGNGIGYYESKE